MNKMKYHYLQQSLNWYFNIFIKISIKLSFKFIKYHIIYLHAASQSLRIAGLYLETVR
jgi:hypothetical protein